MTAAPTFSIRIAVATSIAQQIIAQAGHTPEGIYDYISEYPAKEILRDDAVHWAAPLISNLDGCYEDEDGDRTPLTLDDVRLAVELAVSMNRDTKYGDGAVTRALADSLRAHEEIWARRVGEALAELQAVTQVAVYSYRPERP